MFLVVIVRKMKFMEDCRWFLGRNEGVGLTGFTTVFRCSFDPRSSAFSNSVKSQ